jgi:hypothetical protein
MQRVVNEWLASPRSPRSPRHHASPRHRSPPHSPRHHHSHSHAAAAAPASPRKSAGKPRRRKKASNVTAANVNAPVTAAVDGLANGPELPRPELRVSSDNELQCASIVVDVFFGLLRVCVVDCLLGVVPINRNVNVHKRHRPNHRRNHRTGLLCSQFTLLTSCSISVFCFFQLVFVVIVVFFIVIILLLVIIIVIIERFCSIASTKPRRSCRSSISMPLPIYPAILDNLLLDNRSLPVFRFRISSD